VASNVKEYDAAVTEHIIVIVAVQQTHRVVPLEDLSVLFLGRVEFDNCHQPLVLQFGAEGMGGNFGTQESI
jgi:hypothetical protein